MHGATYKASDDPHGLLEHYPAVRKFSTRFERWYLPAEDITQETYVRALRTLHRRDPPERPRSYLFTIARRVARRLSTQARALGYGREAENARQELLYTASEPIEELVAREECGALGHALGELRERDQELLRRYHVDDESCREIASEMGMSHAAVKAGLKRARERVRQGVERAVEAPLGGG